MVRKTKPLASIIIPVHNEELLIGASLSRLQKCGALSDYEVIVACNGCTDRTEQIARKFMGVIVQATSLAGKSLGLNLGESVASAWPRIYLDVDVEISKRALDVLVNELEDNSLLAASPHLRVDLDNRSFAIRAYYAIWMMSPWIINDMIGSGIYALSERGRERFDIFPEDAIDDLFVSAHFVPGERKCVEGIEFLVPSSDSMRTLVLRKARLLTYNRQARSTIQTFPGRHGSRTGAVKAGLTKPKLWPALIVYVLVSTAAEVVARRRTRRNNFQWDGSRRE